jgi:DNA (cytosine-5)-methyltransferase 1
MTTPITLGSLFDGIGAFPYAASFYGVKTLWASEILPAAVSVTRRHFPDMLHVGDITKLNGAALPPVDIIAFGSPCQDLSQAAGGNRKGLDGERSGLFNEAIRIIREMRYATNGQKPRYAVWENVPGCFSSNARRDYRAVLEAFAESDVPMPESDRWANAGMVRSDAVTLAWCVYDARHFGLAQRRKRVFLVADFGKGSPEEILLIPKSLSGHIASGGLAGKGLAAAFESSADGSEPTVYGICSLHSNSMKSPNPNSGVYEAGTARTLDVSCGNPSCNQGGMAVVAFNGGASPQAGSIAYSETVSPTLKAASSGLRTPCVCEPQIARTLTARGDSSPCADRGQNVVVHPQITGTLCASAAGLSRPGGMVSETDLAVAYCLQGNMIGRDDKNGSTGSGVNAEIAYTLNGTDHHAVTLDCRNFKESGGQSGALQAKSSGGYSLNYQNPVHDGYVVRRLTPTECERLMGFPDEWTKYGVDGENGSSVTLVSDSRRYSMLGNSIATPCAAYIIQGIVEQLEKEVNSIGSTH